MTEFWYHDTAGRELGSVMAYSFSDAHAWLASQGIRYHSVTKFRPRARKGRERRIEKRIRRYGELIL
ncbi:hypothetical protein ACVIKO_005946 [Rhizobium ruizarguesonis]|jgi:hypothetical protein